MAEATTAAIISLAAGGYLVGLSDDAAPQPVRLPVQDVADGVAKATTALQPTEVGTAAFSDAVDFATTGQIGDIATAIDAILGGGDGPEIVYSGTSPGQVYYGDRFGVGGSDSTTAMETAIAYVATNGGTLLLPPGEFTMTRALAITSNAFPFRIRGSVGTKLIRGYGGTGSFISITDCDHFTIDDVDIDCQRSVYGSGSHGIRLVRCSDAAIRRVSVSDWTDTAIIHWDDASGTTYFDRILIEDCFVDGLGVANNGIMLANSRDSHIRGCSATGIDKDGAPGPGFGQQLKGNNLRSHIIDATVTECKVGLVIGGGLEAFPTNIQCTINATVVQGCYVGVKVTDAQYCTVDADIIEMNADVLADRAIWAEDTTNSVFRVGALVNHAGAGAVVYLDACSGSTVDIDHWRNIPAKLQFLSLLNGTGGEYVAIKNFSGTRENFPQDHVTVTHASPYTFRFLDDVMASKISIATDAITLRNRATARVVLDTEASAATDNLATINGGEDGKFVLFTTTDDARNVVLKHGTGNILLKGAVDRTLDLRTDTVALLYNGFAAKWVEV